MASFGLIVLCGLPCVLSTFSRTEYPCNTDLPVYDRARNLTSPGYPQGYNRNTECWWRLQADRGDVVHVHVVDVDLDPYPTAGTYKHIVLLYDGNDDRTMKLGELSVNGANFTSSGSYLFIVFRTSVYGSEGEHRGFLLQYSSHPADVTSCNYNLTAEKNLQYLVSPGYPETYRNNMNCTWNITAQNSYTDYVVRIEVFHSEMEANCRHDNVTVYDGGGRRLGVWCGQNTPVFESSGNNLVVSFTSDSAITSLGFQLKYFLLPVSSTVRQMCFKNVTVTEETGYILSPGYPSRYPSNVYCWWRLRSRERDAKIQLTVINSNTESSYNCMDDSVEVYYGVNNASKWAGRFCGRQSPVFVSDGPDMFVEFYTNLNYNFNGFRIRYTQTRSCTGEYVEEIFADSKFRFLQSPDYPLNYPDNYACRWRISSNSTFVVEVITLTFHLENTQGCKYDYLEIRDGYSEENALLGRFCGLSKPALHSSGPHLFIKFHSDNSNNFAGFRLQYRATETREPSSADAVNLTTVMSSTISLLVFLAIALTVLFCLMRMKRKRESGRRADVVADRGLDRTFWERCDHQHHTVQPTPFIISPPPYELVVSDTRFGLPLDDPPPYSPAEFTVVDKDHCDNVMKTSSSDTAPEEPPRPSASQQQLTQSRDVLTLSQINVANSGLGSDSGNGSRVVSPRASSCRDSPSETAHVSSSREIRAGRQSGHLSTEINSTTLRPGCIETDV